MLGLRSQDTYTFRRWVVDDLSQCMPSGDFGDEPSDPTDEFTPVAQRLLPEAFGEPADGPRLMGEVLLMPLTLGELAAKGLITQAEAEGILHNAQLAVVAEAMGYAAAQFKHLPPGEVRPGGLAGGALSA
ncbi:MAG TPA: hypothetical protein VF466_01140 [Candidatus Saccharimonadales bacterium]